MAETAPSLAPPKRRVKARAGPYSKSGAISLLDARSREAQFMRRVRAELIAHCGGRPNPVQRQLVERAVRLSLALELLDERMMHEGIETGGYNHYIAMSNALSRTLAKIGLDGAAPKLPELADVIAEIDGAA